MTLSVNKKNWHRWLLTLWPVPSHKAFVDYVLMIKTCLESIPRHSCYGTHGKIFVHPE